MVGWTRNVYEGQLMDRAVSDWIPRDVKRTAGRPPTRWSEFFMKSLEARYDAQRVPKASKTHWATLARDREKWRIYSRQLDLRPQGVQVIQMTMTRGGLLIYRASAAILSILLGKSSTNLAVLERWKAW
ncbi:unnamed protein product [Angiostrongylus costaricensis]|uniref:Transposase n=1 Tax=Angiostrongylus costaricensis TaxID=334426 RepID=A0A0R3PAF9_ANGCS|nr:unnamed protein product [Angiostrongylus costaricensis]